MQSAMAAKCHSCEAVAKLFRSKPGAPRKATNLSHFPLQQWDSMILFLVIVILASLSHPSK